MINLVEPTAQFKRFFVISGSAEIEVCAKDEKEAVEIAQLYFNDYLNIHAKEITPHVYSDIN